MPSQAMTSQIPVLLLGRWSGGERQRPGAQAGGPAAGALGEEAKGHFLVKRDWLGS